MQKHTFKNKKHLCKQAFTLIELLIVIAIIGILFIVLVSKVDFATDKAKASGVQTDFRSYQMAFDTVAKENAGFNTFGWDTGDANQDGIRNSYDEGDNGAGGGVANNGIQDGTEVFTGHKVYAENFTKVFSLKKNGTGSYDRDALNRLEAAINANLDPKLHITIANDGTITMANGAQDPWNREYHGAYITNAETDGKDRGAIVMYSDGANNEFGSEHKIANGIVSISIPGSNKNGKDDYAVVSCYTYLNGYGEVKNITTGFSNNQTSTNVVIPSNSGDIVNVPEPNPTGDLGDYTWSQIKALANAQLTPEEYQSNYGIHLGDKIDNKYILVDYDNYGGFVFMFDSEFSKSMNEGITNTGGYPASEMTVFVDGLYLDLQNSNRELYNAIKRINVVCNDGFTQYQNGIYTHTLENVGMFLASAYEVGMNVSGWSYNNGYLQEGWYNPSNNQIERFEYFTSNAIRQSIYSTSSWWLRSALSNMDTSFCGISKTGGYDGTGSDIEWRVVPCFVVG